MMESKKKNIYKIKIKKIQKMKKNNNKNKIITKKKKIIYLKSKIKNYNFLIFFTIFCLNLCKVKKPKKKKNFQIFQ